MPAIVSTIVEVCVFRFGESAPEYLLLKRSADDALYPGIWQLVTGTIRDGEKAVEAALREVQEETGLLPTHFWIVPHASVFYDQHADAMHVGPMFAVQVERDARPVLSAEHEAFVWMHSKSAQERLVWPGQRQGLEVVDRFIVGGEDAKRLSEIPL